MNQSEEIIEQFFSTYPDYENLIGLHFYVYSFKMKGYKY